MIKFIKSYFKYRKFGKYWYSLSKMSSDQLLEQLSKEIYFNPKNKHTNKYVLNEIHDRVLKQAGRLSVFRMELNDYIKETVIDEDFHSLGDRIIKENDILIKLSAIYTRATSTFISEPAYKREMDAISKLTLHNLTLIVDLLRDHKKLKESFGA